MKTTLLSLSLVFALASTGAAFAQDQGQMQGGQMQGPNGGGHHGAFTAACGADVQTYCASAQTRDDRHACVQANMAKFSDSCKSFMASHQHGGGQMQGPGGQ
jgi:uncharacterized protein YdeI (BOF family)